MGKDGDSGGGKEKEKENRKKGRNVRERERGRKNNFCRAGNRKVEDDGNRGRNWEASSKKMRPIGGRRYGTLDGSLRLTEPRLIRLVAL